MRVIFKLNNGMKLLCSSFHTILLAITISLNNDNCDLFLPSSFVFLCVYACGRARVSLCEGGGGSEDVCFSWYFHLYIRSPGSAI